MGKTWHGMAVLSAAILLAACADYKQYRTRTLHKSGATDICEIEKRSDSKGNCAVEHRKYTTSKGKEFDYYLGFVEFDDQGWFWDRRQMEALLRVLYQKRKKGKEQDYLIFAHAHGWQHNAGACDNNVICFQRLLERFDIMERRGAKVSKVKPRTVVGIYIGWRGRSLTIPVIDNLSFWERKNTAERVGLGGVTELLTRLNDLRRYMNPDRSRHKTQLIISGHSFGGQVIYSALSHSLLERAARMKCAAPGRDGDRETCPDGVPISHATANSFGDLVVLVNPAFEGTIYEPLYHVATNRCFGPKQRPAMLIVTSKADQATKTAFPLGRGLSTFFETTQSRESQAEQKQTILDTVGHLYRYRTHELKLTDEKYKKPDPALGTEECGCPYLAATADFEIDQFENDFLRETFAQKEESKSSGYVTWPKPPEKGERIGSVNYGEDLVLLPTQERQYAANFPYLVVSTDKDIIADHNAIYGENFTDFLRRFYVRHINARINFPAQCFPEGDKAATGAGKRQKLVPQCQTEDSEITPCKQSCQRDEKGKSCSGRTAG